MLSAGTASASSRKPLCGVLRTRAIPAGVTTLHSPGLVKWWKLVLLQLMVVNAILAEEIHGDSCGNSGQSETPQNEVQGGSRVTRGKRSVFPEWVSTPTIISDYVAVYRFCVKNNNPLVGRVIAAPNF